MTFQTKVCVRAPRQDRMCHMKVTCLQVGHSVCLHKWYMVVGGGVGDKTWKGGSHFGLN